MSRITIVVLLFLSLAFKGLAQKVSMDTLGITDGSVHMRGSVPYTQFLKKYKGGSDLVIHIWYNPSGSTFDKKEIKAGKDEVYFLYGRNLRSGSSEMEFKFGANAKSAFSKKKEEEMEKLVDFLQFDVFPNQHFNGDLALEALDRALE